MTYNSISPNIFFVLLVPQDGQHKRDKKINKSDKYIKAYFLSMHIVKSWLIGKDSNAGRDWGQEEKGMTEDEMAGWHHWLDGREFELRELVLDREAWRAAIHGVAKSWTRLSDWSDLNTTQP